MEIDLEIGDVILAGKFKNKRKIVKDIGKDNLGQPTVNGMKALNFRVEKLMPKDKWSKESKEALEFAEDVNEMKLTKRQLRRIIKEALMLESLESLVKKHAKAHGGRSIDDNIADAMADPEFAQLGVSEEELADAMEAYHDKMMGLY